MLDYIRALWVANPVRSAAILTAAIVAAAKAAGLALDEASVGEVVAVVGLIIGGGEAARSQVSPYVGEVGPPSDDLLPPVPAP